MYRLTSTSAEVFQSRLRQSGILDNLLTARRSLTRYLELAENDQQRQRAARLLQELSQQLH